MTHTSVFVSQIAIFPSGLGLQSPIKLSNITKIVMVASTCRDVIWVVSVPGTRANVSERSTIALYRSSRDQPSTVTCLRRDFASAPTLRP